MPRYVFHTARSERDRDMGGMELRDAAAARIEAIRFAGSLLTNEPELFRIEVTDRTHRLLFTGVALAIDAPCFETMPEAAELT